MPKDTLTISELEGLKLTLQSTRDLVIMCLAYKELDLTGSPHVVLTALQEMAADLGLELVKRHPTDALLDQMTGKTTAADLVQPPDFPNGVVNR
ncbi:hypothetical protein [Taklimakanibacter deserti]|uniref:hypothetical protein n=1 Tax=Taklimakanibacter deserti TaxID=2267839 RepID=UPI000E6512E3